MGSDLMRAFGSAVGLSEVQCGECTDGRNANDKTSDLEDEGDAPPKRNAVSIVIAVEALPFEALIARIDTLPACQLGETSQHREREAGPSEPKERCENRISELWSERDRESEKSSGDKY